MFTSTVINLVILLAFTYFLSSIMVSAVNEAILGMLNRRYNYLKKALIRLFNDDGWKKYISGHDKNPFFDSTHIKPLFKDSWQKPSYIPFQNFLLTLVEHVGARAYKTSFSTAISNSPTLNPVVKKSLEEIIAKSKGRIDPAVNNYLAELKAFEEELEQYYNNTMDRATGWYKRETGIVLFLLSFIMCVVFNIDTIKIANEGLKDPQKLDVAAEKISQYMEGNRTGTFLLPNGDTVFINKKDTTKGNVSTVRTSSSDSLKNVDSANANHANTKESAAIESDSTIKRTKEKVTAISDLYTTVSGYKFGYEEGMKKEWGENFILKLLGIIITCFALQQGSQFWFDTLNKFVNLRSTGKKPTSSKS